MENYPQWFEWYLRISLLESVRLTKFLHRWVWRCKNYLNWEINHSSARHKCKIYENINNICSKLNWLKIADSGRCIDTSTASDWAVTCHSLCYMLCSHCSVKLPFICNDALHCSRNIRLSLVNGGTFRPFFSLSFDSLFY